MTKKYKNGVKLVRFPGGRVARFHKPGTKAHRKGAAKKRAAGRLLAKKFGFAKRRRNPVRGARNPDNIRTGRPRAVRAPDYMYHSRTPASLRTKWVVIGTDYGYLHNTAGEVRTWDTRSGAAAAAKRYVSLSGIPTIIGNNPRVSKTKIVYVVQGNYGSHGWEDENEEDNKVDAKRSIKEYRENGPGSYRLIRRRVKIEGNPRRRAKRKMSGSEARAVFDSYNSARDREINAESEKSRGAWNTALLKRLRAKRNPQEAFNVYRKGRLIDTVFATGYTTDEMKRSLINHDGYPSDIRVTKAKRRK